MARDRDGWEYVDGGPRWAPTVEVAMSNILVGKHGHEYDEAKRELDDLVRAARRDAAEELRSAATELHEKADGYGTDAVMALGVGRAADMIFPDYPEEFGGE